MNHTAEQPVKKILALTGMCGSGKSSVAKLLSETHRIPGVYFGSVTFKQLQAAGITRNASSEAETTHQLRETQGMDIYAKLLLPDIEHLLTLHSVIYLDSLYSAEEFYLLKAYFSKRAEMRAALQLVEVYADKPIRYERLRTRNHRPFTRAESIERDHHDITRLNKAPLLALADFKLGNNADLAQLTQAVAKLLSKIS